MVSHIYCFLSEVDILFLLKPSIHLQRVFSDQKQPSFTLQEPFSNVVFRTTTVQQDYVQSKYTPEL